MTPVSVAVNEEKEGLLKIIAVYNDGQPSSWILLTQFKCVIQRQLPEMPPEYIARIVYDKKHVSLCAIRKNLLVGGICYRPFEERTFAEIVFLAISATDADQAATGYFRKQGFSANITLNAVLWVGYVKDYMGAILMHCPMLPKIKYLEAKKILGQQKAAVLEHIEEHSQSHVVHEGLNNWKSNPSLVMEPYQIPGILESGWSKEMSQVIATRPQHGPLYQTLSQLLEGLSGHSAAWPFQEPVNAAQVPEYYNIITDPMDLKTMYTRLEQDYYTTLDIFVEDFDKIGRNCRRFNAVSSNYVKLINRLESKFKEMLNTIKCEGDQSRIVTK